MFGRYGMGRNSGRRGNRRAVGYGCRVGSTTQKELLEEQKVLLERRLEIINSQLEFYKGE